MRKDIFYGFERRGFFNIFIISLILSGLFVVFLYYYTGYVERQTIIDAPSKCYTTLQPQNFFGGEDVMPVTVDNNSLLIRYKGENRRFHIGKASKSGSMRAVIPDSSLTIWLVPKNKSEVRIGDVVRLKREDKPDLAHRIINITIIGNYVYYRSKGDNCPYIDHEIWDFNDIKYKLVGILY